MSGLFGDLLKPGDGSAFALKAELELRAKRGDDRAAVARFLLRRGESWQGAPTPEEYRHLRGEVQRCFNNALAAAVADSSLTYVEGVYNVGGRTAEHAWCVDPQGRIVELTFMDPDGTGGEFISRDSATGVVRPTRAELFAYMGVRIPTDTVQRCLADLRASFGDNRWGVLHPENGAPAIKLLTGVAR